MATVQDIRRENLRYLIQIKFGGVANRMATETGIKQMQIARVFLNTDNRREVGERLARRIEEVCGLERGWMDQSHAQSEEITSRLEMLSVTDRKAVISIIDSLLSKQDPYLAKK